MSMTALQIVAWLACDPVDICLWVLGFNSKGTVGLYSLLA